MKKTLILLSLLTALSITACDKKTSITSEAQTLVDETEFTEKGLLDTIADKKAISATEYEAILGAIETCKVDEETLEISFNCAALKALRTVRDNNDYAMAEGVDVKQIQTELLKTNTPKVQTFLIDEMKIFIEIDKEDKTYLLDIAKATAEPMILRAIIHQLRTGMSDKDIADFILSHVDSKSPAIRLVVADAVTSPWSKNVDGMVDIAIKFLNDDDKEVRKNTCETIGALGNEKVIDPIDAILKNKEEIYRHNECMQTLHTLWYDYPEHRNTSAAAYKASLDYLKQTPRTAEFPAWAGMHRIGLIGKDNIENWKARASYFNVDEYLAVMTDMAADANYDSIARSSAVKVIAAWGTKKDLEALKLKLTAGKDPNAVRVIQEIDEVMTEKNDI